MVTTSESRPKCLRTTKQSIPSNTSASVHRVCARAETLADAAVPLLPKRACPSPKPLALKFGLQASSGEKTEHSQVAQQRPQRIGEGSRPVALDEEMAGPGEAVGDHNRGHDRAPVQNRESGREQRDPGPGADEVQRPVRRAAVLPQVERPKLRIALDSPGHGGFSCNCGQGP